MTDTNNTATDAAPVNTYDAAMQKSVGHLLGYIASSEAERSFRTAQTVAALCAWLASGTNGGGDMGMTPDDVRTAALGEKPARAAAMKTCAAALSAMSPAAAKDTARLKALGTEYAPATAARKAVSASGLIGDAAAVLRDAKARNNPADEAKAYDTLAELAAERDAVKERLSAVKRANRAAVERVVKCAAYIDAQSGMRNPSAVPVGKNKGASLLIECRRDNEFLPEAWSMAKLIGKCADHVKYVIDADKAKSDTDKTKADGVTDDTTKDDNANAPENDSGRGTTKRTAAQREADFAKILKDGDNLHACIGALGNILRTEGAISDGRKDDMLALYSTLRDALSDEVIAAYEKEHAAA